LKQALRLLAFSGSLTQGGIAGWKRVRVGEAVTFLNGYAFKSEWFVPRGVRLVRNLNIGHGSIDWRESACVAEERFAEFSAFALAVGDVLLSLDRPIISTGLKVAVVEASDLPCLLLQRVARLAPKPEVLRSDFLLHWLRSPLFVEVIDPGRSNGVPHISTKQVASLTIPQPDLAEQQRIVCKLDELLALCDRLKAHIAAARARQGQLAEVLVAQAAAA
jgi:type I restriction enzyme S subunit